MTDKQIRKAAGVSYAYPIQTVEGDQPPKLVGKPYWKTNFSAHGGRFQKTLYTPSTRRIVVGKDWIEKNDPELVYNRDEPIL